MRGPLSDQRSCRPIATTLLLAYLSGCSGWMGVAGSPPGPVPDNERQLRITLPDSSRVLLHNPQVTRDSLIGEWVSDSGAQLGRKAFLLHEVKKVEVRGISAGKTVVLVGMMVGLVVGIGGAIKSSMCVPWCAQNSSGSLRP